MFGLVPFVSQNDLSSRSEEDPFDRMMKAFDEPFFPSFRTPDFKVDVKDNGDSYDVTAELPGMKKEDIQLTYKDSYLTIGAKSATAKDEKDSDGNYIRRERSASSMSRSFYIDGIDESKATADYKDGILSVHLPKMAVQAEPSHTIEIRS